MTWFRRSAHPEDELSAYVDGELDERARRAVETHLASCEACSTLLGELQDTKSLLSELPRVAPARSFTLGAQHAREYRPAPAAHRMSFSFAPAVALTVLVALLFVDAANFSGGSDEDATLGAANSTASRQSAPEAAGGLASEALEADKQDDAGTDALAPADGEAGGAAASSAAPPLADEPQPSEEPEDLQTFSADAAEDETEIPAAPEAGPEDTHVLGTDDSSGGLSTLRILEIAAAIAFAASLAVVFLPRLTGRKER